MRIIDLSFFFNESTSAAQVVAQHWPAIGYVAEMKGDEIELIKFLETAGFDTFNGIQLTTFQGKRSFFHIPVKAIAYIAARKPDAIIVQGLGFPLQVMYLRRKLGKQVKILVQHHGEKPFNGLKRKLQAMADNSVDGYLFTSRGNAAPWIKAGVIKRSDRIFELLEASTVFHSRIRARAKQDINWNGDYNFLWVGRLNTGKDPITILKAFGKFAAKNPAARLYMIYSDDQLLSEVERFIAADEHLKHAVSLVGKKDHEELENFYNAADFFISGSHSEGSGYALIEAMACGCIPVVTDIPPFRKITANGEYGFLFPPGDVDKLLKVLDTLPVSGREKYHERVSGYFEKELSFKAIANRLSDILENLKAK